MNGSAVANGDSENIREGPVENKEQKSVGNINASVYFSYFR